MEPSIELSEYFEMDIKPKLEDLPYQENSDNQQTQTEENSKESNRQQHEPNSCKIYTASGFETVKST